MNKLLSMARLAAAVCGLTFGSAAYSAPPGPTHKFYVGLEGGRSNSDGEVSQQFFGPTVRRPTGNATGIKLRAGYQFTRYVALEGGFVDFGEFSAHDIPYACAVGGGVTTCTFDVRSHTRGAFIDVAGSWPFAERWALNARLGAIHAESRTTEHDPAVASSRRRYSDSNAGLMYGAGVSFAFSARVEAELSWSEFDQLGLGLNLGGGAAVFDLGSSRLLSLGARYRF
jgi:opacity protein-like surface antigen